MTEINNILGGSDNLWKYLFTFGVLLVSISILYPLKQSEVIDLKVIELKNDSKSISKRIEHLKSDMSEYSSYLAFAKVEMDSLNKLEVNKINADKVNSIEIEISEEKRAIKEKIKNVQMLVIENEGKENYINELTRQSKNYKKYFQFGFWFGLVILLGGLYKWFIATIASDRLRWKELGESERVLLRSLFPKICKRKSD